VTPIHADAAVTLPSRSTLPFGLWGDVTTWPSEGVVLLILLVVVLVAAAVFANWGNRSAPAHMEALDAPSLPMPTPADNPATVERLPVPIPAGDPTAGEREPHDI